MWFRAGAVVGLLLWAGTVVAMIYVVAHFVVKYW